MLTSIGVSNREQVPLTHATDYQNMNIKHIEEMDMNVKRDFYRDVYTILNQI